MLAALEACMIFFSLNLVWVQCEVCIQQLSGIIVRLALVDLVGRVSDLYIHGPIGHPLVLESLGPKQNIDDLIKVQKELQAMTQP